MKSTNSGSRNPVLESNLTALQHRCPETAHALEEALPLVSGFSGVQTESNGTITLHNESGKQIRVLDPPPGNMPSPPNAIRILLGIGNGTLLSGMLAHGQTRVIVIEKEPALLVHFLSAQDLSPAIDSAQLSIMVPFVSGTAVTDVSLHDIVCSLNRLHLNGESFTFVNSGSVELCNEFYTAINKSCLFFTTMHSRLMPLRRHGSSFQSDITVVSPNCRIFNDLAHALARPGIGVNLHRVPDHSDDWTPENRLKSLKALSRRPSRYLLLRNRCLMETASAREPLAPELYLDSRLVHWWWDRPNVSSCIDMKRYESARQNIVFAKDMTNRFDPPAQWLPPGALTRFTDCAPPPAPDMGITLVGQSRVQRLAQNLTVLRNFLSGIRLEETVSLARGMQFNKDIIGLYHFLSQNQIAIRSGIDRISSAFPFQAYYLRYILDMCTTAAFRICCVKVLTNADIPVHVFGDKGWLESNAIKERDYKGLLSPEQLPEVYGRSRLNLNVNFMQVSSAVNPRVLDICAAGGVVVTDPTSDMTDLFPESRLRPFTFSRPEELPDTVNAILNADRAEYRHEMMQHVRANHSIRNRADEILNLLDLKG